jgi:catechol 2,3-dioxygenase-like lactoylglutathione lyase family enzyme
MKLPIRTSRGSLVFQYRTEWTIFIFNLRQYLFAGIFLPFAKHHLSDILISIDRGNHEVTSRKVDAFPDRIPEVHMPVELSPLVHIEIVVPDAEAAYQFLHDALGAEKVQEEFAAFLDGDLARVIHVGLGDVVLQFIQPIAEGGSWYEQLRDKGPGVHNLTYVVDDMRATVKALADEGVEPKFFFPLDWGAIIGPDNVKPDVQPVYMMDTMDKIGFHLELSETPWKEPPDLPETKYVTGMDELIGGVSPMLHIELVVPDAEETYRFLNAVFGSEKVEKEFAGFLDSDFMHIVHVNLGNVVLQYCQPLVDQMSWHEQLKSTGSGVHNITFVVENMDETMKAVEAAGAQDLFAFPLDWGELIGRENVKPDVPPVHMVNTMDKLGFHLELCLQKRSALSWKLP